MDNYVLPLFSGLCGRKPLHAKIEKELQENKQWPVLSEAPSFESGVEMYDSGTKLSLISMSNRGDTYFVVPSSCVTEMKIISVLLLHFKF